MCSMAKKIACQITFLPIVSKDYLSDIHHVITIIKTSKVEYNIGMLSTEIKGEKNEIFKLIKIIYDEMDERCDFSMEVRYSNVCGQKH